MPVILLISFLISNSSSLISALALSIDLQRFGSLLLLSSVNFTDGVEFASVVKKYHSQQSFNKFFMVSFSSKNCCRETEAFVPHKLFKTISSQF